MEYEMTSQSYITTINNQEFKEHYIQMECSVPIVLGIELCRSCKLAVPGARGQGGAVVTSASAAGNSTKKTLIGKR